jgi:hypothetical protein
MHIRSISLGTIAAMAVIISSCSKNTEKVVKNSNVVGSWEWLRTDGGLANQIHDTPVSTGNIVKLRIEEDNKYYMFTNGILTSQGTYLLESRKCIHDQRNKTFINFSSDRDMMVETVNEDLLALSDEAYDGIESLFQRKQMKKE